MRPFRRQGDHVDAWLSPAECQVLTLLLDQLEQVLADDAPGDTVRERLFPAGHASDADIAADYRDLTESSLREGKTGDLALVRASVPDGGGVRLDDDQARAWLRTTNDLRLALGTRMGITAQTGPPDPDDPSQEMSVYQWLTAVQGSLVDAFVAGGARRT
ncbi:protein of unknown function [Klenkia soli]|uniref:Uncharacterized protein n=1 Tax=Klenkia soli TaxID=1052260 RepID=A0A1H0K6T0_9ACTN|nr:DUF2017 family protein [Klenkia soli]SDO51596.1 protein of unknown function [Klenkia soli]